jgi:hypothetical protein
MLHLDLYLPTEANSIRKYRTETNVKIITANTSAKIINEQ